MKKILPLFLVLTSLFSCGKKDVFIKENIIPSPKEFVLNNDKLHKIRIEGLQPGQKYYYRVCSQEILSYKAYSKEFGKTAVSEFSTFELPEADEDEFTAIIFNDLHQRTNTFQALLEQVKEVDYDFVFFNGDCIDDPRDRAQASYILKQFTEGVKADQVPVFFMRGNHEIRNAYSIGLRNHLHRKSSGAIETIGICPFFFHVYIFK